MVGWHRGSETNVYPLLLRSHCGIDPARGGSMMIYRTSFFLGIFFPAFNLFAHHSFSATFNGDVITELEGVVTEVRWRNPHITFVLKSLDSNGDEVFWDMESQSLSIMRRMELASPFIGVGDQITVAGNPARRSDLNSVFARNILLPSGEEWVFRFGASPADLRWSDRLLGTTEKWFATEGETSESDRGIFRVWSTSLSFGGGGLRKSDYPLTDSAQVAVIEFDPIEDAPLANCAPKGMSYIMTQPYPMEFVDKGDKILLRIEEYDSVRTIYMADAALAEEPPPSLLGYSVGHWENDTLVVRTTRVNYPHFDGTGIPQSEAVEFTERITAFDDVGQLDYKITVIDPETFTEPVLLEKSWVWLSGVSVEPYDCTVGD